MTNHEHQCFSRRVQNHLHIWPPEQGRLQVQQIQCQCLWGIGVVHLLQGSPFSRG